MKMLQRLITIDEAQSFVKVFKLSAILILVLTAGAKLVSATGKQGVLDATDPILGLHIRNLLVVLAVLELGAVFLLLNNRKIWFPCLLVGAMGAQFLLYHIMFAMGGYNRGCPCLGTVAQRLPFSQANIDKTLVITAAWLCIGGLISSYLSAHVIENVERNTENVAKLQ